MLKILKSACLLALASTILFGCKKSEEALTEVDPGIFADKPFNIDNLNDTYASIAPLSYSWKWGPYNTHDPSILKVGDWYYCYSTDVAYGATARIGIMVRKSKDLVDWKFVGWALDALPSQAVNYIQSQQGTPVQGLWAPYIMKVGSEFRLYYSLAPTQGRTSAIGLLTSSSPEGPWVEKGLAVTSINTGPGTNAIDPSVVVTPSGQHWMVYGSSWDGLYELELNPQTGLAKTSGDRGTRIVRRGSTNGMINGNLEGAEIIYNAEKNMYYLFVSYDWLSTKYNVRVFKSPNPNGPFVDFNGINVDNAADNDPMILAPYKFNGHGGWQGTAHCAVFKDDNNQYYMAHQGRPGADPAAMVLHVRKMFWLNNGWPAVSPERYANVAQTPITRDSLVGKYEKILLLYSVVPGFGNEQTSPQMNATFAVDDLRADGTIGGDATTSWSYEAPYLITRFANGLFVDRVYVSRERDWENKKASTIVYTGMNGGGLGIWGKKIQ
ncbi:arabinan endo-1,5-alpha-L-arabinosidase [Desertivirga arenae]|uniref:arabinan endo-1,5-alpha-L-arabinosidase n=1 Tax=Desertivirga arenae TaxID=2810309 RepID=UPI001A95BF3A|nr:arabinan endo-1,5-alpha-L-arabinosidase [Pedobacter sp. SYSU D00823]